MLLKRIHLSPALIGMIFTAVGQAIATPGAVNSFKVFKTFFYRALFVF